MLILFNCLLSVKIIITQKHFSVNGRAAKYRKINFADNINLCFYVLRTNFADGTISLVCFSALKKFLPH
jgi:hypothetical protein